MDKKYRIIGVKDVVVIINSAEEGNDVIRRLHQSKRIKTTANNKITHPNGMIETTMGEHSNFAHFDHETSNIMISKNLVAHPHSKDHPDFCKRHNCKYNPDDYVFTSAADIAIHLQ